MLRTLKSTKLGTRIVSYTATTTGVGAFSVTNGIGAIAATNASAGGAQLDIALRNPFRRAPVVIATPGGSIGDGGAAALTAAPTLSTASVITVNGSNANDVGQQHGFLIGNDSPITDNMGTVTGTLNPVFSDRRSARMIAAAVSTASVVTSGTNQITSTTGGTGIFAVTFKRPFAQPPVVQVCGLVGGSNARVDSVTANGCNVRTFSAADSATNLGFHLIALGSDALGDSVSSKGRAIQIQMRKPRLIHAIIPISGGTPSISPANSDITLVDTGAGQITVNFATPFARAPVVIATSVDATSRYCAIATVAAGSTLLSAGSNAGINGDPLAIHVLIVGSDDVAEY